MVCFKCIQIKRKVIQNYDILYNRNPTLRKGKRKTNKEETNAGESEMKEDLFVNLF